MRYSRSHERLHAFPAAIKGNAKSFQSHPIFPCCSNDVRGVGRRCRWKAAVDFLREGFQIVEMVSGVGICGAGGEGGIGGEEATTDTYYSYVQKVSTECFTQKM